MRMWRWVRVMRKACKVLRSGWGSGTSPASSWIVDATCSFPDSSVARPRIDLVYVVTPTFYHASECRAFPMLSYLCLGAPQCGLDSPAPRSGRLITGSARRSPSWSCIVHDTALVQHPRHFAFELCGSASALRSLPSTSFASLALTSRKW